MKIFRAFDAPHAQATHLSPSELTILATLENDWRNLMETTNGHGRFDPRLLDAALPHAFMLERTAPSAMRIRVAGQNLHDLLRMDPRGMSFASIFRPALRDAALNLAEAAFTMPAVVGIPLKASRGVGRRPLRAEALLLPLHHGAQEVTRVIGALVTTGDPTIRGLRFDLATDVPLRCDPIMIDKPERRTHRAETHKQRASLTNQTGPCLIVDNT